MTGRRGTPSAGSLQSAAAAAVDAERLRHGFEELAAIGALAGGGCERLAFTAEEREAHARFQELAAEAGLSVRSDEIGNSFARLTPADQADQAAAAPVPRAPLLSGSHLDTVSQAGCFDGAAGVVCALEAARAAGESLTAGGVPLRRAIEVVAWANEEGARFAPAMMGSGVYSGLISLENARNARDSDGVTVAQALGRPPGAATATAPVAGAAPAAYIELHAEQGTALERAGLHVAVVEGVQAQVAGSWTVRGRAAHAGTTAMDQRSDALLAASRIVEMVGDSAAAHPPGVGTVGSLFVSPGSRNSVPGEVRATLDFRHPEEAELTAMEEAFESKAVLIAERAGCEFSYLREWRAARVDFDAGLLSGLEAAAGAAGVKQMRLFSAAGHDAVQLARIGPAAMLFVPSRAGVSHHPDEYTPPAALEAGARVLAAALAALAAGP